MIKLPRIFLNYFPLIWLVEKYFMREGMCIFCNCDLYKILFETVSRLIMVNEREMFYLFETIGRKKGNCKLLTI